MKVFNVILVLSLACFEADLNGIRVQGAPVIPAALTAGQIAKNSRTTDPGHHPKKTIDLGDYPITGDGTMNDTNAMSALLRAVGSSPVRLIMPTGSQSVLNTIAFPSNVTLDFSAGGALKPATGQTITILGGIIGTMHQIFYNALPGQGTIDFTGGDALEAVHPEWWGASPGASASINTPALQAAEHAAFGTNRTNGSGLARYNRELRLCGTYEIKDELRFYHVIGFRITGCGGKFSTGFRQTAANKRIIDGQNIAYGVFEQIKFEITPYQNVPLVDIDNDHKHGLDLSPQNITFWDVSFAGHGLGQIAVLIAKHGGDAQGDNIRCYSCYGSGFTEAVWQIGGNNTGINAGRFYAQNAIKEQIVGGDFQGNPKYGIAVYGGSISVDGTTMENGTLTQTGFDVYCEAVQDTCLAAGSSFDIVDSRTLNQAFTFDAIAGSAVSAGQLITGSWVGGDGKYYQVTGGGTLGGLLSRTASNGSATTLVTTGLTSSSLVGMKASIVSGTGKGLYGIITANSTTTITFAAGLVSDYQQAAGITLFPTPVPDNTSVFVVEPNWGKQTTSGGVTFAQVEFNGIDAPQFAGGVCTAVLEDVTIIGGKINCTGAFRRVGVSRTDWVPTVGGINNQLDDTLVTTFYQNVTVARPGAAAVHYLLPWSLPRNNLASATYKNWTQMQLGTQPIVWSGGAHGGGASARDVSIGGRSDTNGGPSDVSRAVLEYTGLLGAPTAIGTDQNGSDTGIQGGLPTGAGTPGNINFWLGNTGSTGATVIDGGIQATITPIGFGFVKGKGQHFFNQAANSDMAGSGASPLTVTFTTKYTSTPICVVIDVSATPAIVAMSAYSNTGFTATGTAGHTLNYICIGNPN